MFEVAMIRYFKVLAPIALLAMAGCAAPFQAQVSRFQQLPAPQGQTFAIVADNPRLDGSLEFGQYANTVAQRLAGYGYTRAVSPGDANLVVRLDYTVDKGRDFARRRASGRASVDASAIRMVGDRIAPIGVSAAAPGSTVSMIRSSTARATTRSKATRCMNRSWR
jgi:hypothetical protein